jgi:hypothetical protein
MKRRRLELEPWKRLPISGPLQLLIQRQVSVEEVLIPRDEEGVCVEKVTQTNR